MVRARGLAIAADCRDLDAAYAFISHSLEAGSASAAASAQAAAATDSVLVTAPSSWEAWKQAWREVIPPEGPADARISWIPVRDPWRVSSSGRMLAAPSTTCG